MNIPEVRMQYSWLLATTVTPELAKKYKPEKEYTDEDYIEWTNGYRNAWSKKSNIILTAMQDVFDLEFKRTIIDVALAPWLPTISNPLIMGYQYEPDEFVDALTHELFHVLFTDNTIYSSRDGDPYDEKLHWQALYGDSHSINTLVHIPVHAGLKYIYLDILKEPHRLKRDIKFSQDYEDYKLAWDYVEANDYKDIIEKLKQDYKRIQDEN